MRNNHPIDPLLMTLDRALRSVFVPPLANRPLPQPAGDPSLPEAPLTEAERKASAALMRVNHAGEVAAQALYHGQAAFAGDRASLGFVSETERQVEGHIGSHLARLPAHDVRSRAILEAMRSDEIEHGADARAAGGVELPAPVRAAMRASAKVMTTTSYWL